MVVEGSQVVLLRCSACGHELSGLGNDRIFLCASCGRAWVLEDSSPVRVPVRFPDPDWVREVSKGSGDPLIHMPFWRIGSRISIPERIVRPDLSSSRTSLDTDREEPGLVRTQVPDRAQDLLFPAFSCTRSLSVGVELSIRPCVPPALEDSPDRLPSLVGGTVGPGDARRLAEAVAVGIEMSRDDFLARMDLRLEVLEQELLAMPCLAEARGLRVAGAGILIHWRNLEDCRDILAFHGLEPLADSRSDAILDHGSGLL
ncbi:hypothetical protein JW921_09575 [Candidatus Fermentibacterales bacterium]|nr:hypothetical protein [Candidatus Fermentibacterales bacterium]